MATVDLNSDVGEGAGTEKEIMPFVTSANIACGAHAGDEETMRETVRLALAHKVAVGAHPGYRDPANFGRTPLGISADELIADLVLQIETLRATPRSENTDLVHVKANGALYNPAQKDESVAASIVAAMRRVASDLVLYAFPGSALERA